MITVCGISIVVLQAGFIFILLCLLPAIICWFTDNRPDKLIFKSVFACNLAGALPALSKMIWGALGLRPYELIPAMQDVHVWLYAYSGAAAGWCLVFICRFIARIFLAASYEHRVHSLERLQQRLLDEWGNKIIPSDNQ